MNLRHDSKIQKCGFTGCYQLKSPFLAIRSTKTRQLMGFRDSSMSDHHIVSALIIVFVKLKFCVAVLLVNTCGVWLLDRLN